MQQYDDFRRDFLDNVAAALGLTFEQLSADYADGTPSHEREAQKAVARWWRQWHREQMMWAARRRALMAQIVIDIYLSRDAAGLTLMVAQRVGYNPQLLLPRPITEHA